MSRVLRIQAEQQEDNSFEVWFDQYPQRKVHAMTLKEALAGLNAIKADFVADGGDPRSLAVEDPPTPDA